jgi:hypothetical protein
MYLDGVFEMFEWFTKKRKKKPTVTDRAPPASATITSPKVEKTPKDIATEAGEPYVAIVSMDIDSNNLHQGAFELDWNDIFVARLVKAGYMLKATDTDADMVDRWFQNVCRHVVMETWEQEQAIKTGFIKERNLGDGRSEVS